MIAIEKYISLTAMIFLIDVLVGQCSNIYEINYMERLKRSRQLIPNINDNSQERREQAIYITILINS